ncbi:hypothetical protein ACFL1M_01225 [Patescibacteria group bacterium]
MIKPYIIIPNLIEQPTWGGEYITKYKQLKNEKLQNKKIGQSYELYEHSNFSKKTSTENTPTIEFGVPNNPRISKTFGDGFPINIQELIDEDPAKTLGERAIKIHGEKMGVLIKFTQAKGNSYQLHAKKKSKNWQPKPESWYYLEPGLITLGVKKNINWNDYQETCFKINNFAKELSSQIKSGLKKVDEARNDLKDFISKHNPEKYVNLIETKKEEAIDLSECGVHHSWEESGKYPQGNIVYEVQKNVYDPVSTIRSFDKGKIKDDGSIRAIQLDDYFKHIDKSEEANDFKTHIVSPITIEKTNSFLVERLFINKNYILDKMVLSEEMSNNHTTTSKSFHHLFVKEGKIQINSDQNQLTLTKGFSAFIPASTGKYKIIPDEDTVILKTHL